MKKISYRLVYNRKKRLNASGKALIQVEAYLTKRKVYFSTHIYVRPEQWDARKARIICGGLETRESHFAFDAEIRGFGRCGLQFICVR